MKTLYHVFGLLVLSHTQGAFGQEADWIWQNPLPQGNTLHAVHFVDDVHGWGVGEAGTIVHTIDGGQTWALQPSGTAAALADVHFVDAQRGWSVGTGLVLQTTDGGQTWTPVEPGATEPWEAVYFADADHGWVAGEQTILRTRDGGQTWTTQVLDGTFFLNGLHGRWADLEEPGQRAPRCLLGSRCPQPRHYFHRGSR